MLLDEIRLFDNDEVQMEEISSKPQEKDINKFDTNETSTDNVATCHRVFQDQ